MNSKWDALPGLEFEEVLQFRLEVVFQVEEEQEEEQETRRRTRSGVPRSACTMKFASLLFAAAASLAHADNDPSFDHQQKTYKASFEPVSAQNLDMSLTPFFSPDHSIDTLVGLINEAKTSIDIETPGVGSWSGCSSGSTCIGCSVEDMNAEEFPVFPALLNAVHRGVTVRIITNNYNDVVCEGEIDMLNFWALNGIQVKWYQVWRVLCWRACVKTICLCSSLTCV